MGTFCSCFKSSGDPSPEVNQLQERRPAAVQNQLVERRPSAEEKQLEDKRLSRRLSYRPVSCSLESQLTPVSGNESSAHGGFERSRSHRYYKRLREKFSVDNDGTTPRLDCILIPSFGSCPPSNVAEKKATSHFLQGVGDDLKIVQQLIQEDGHKELIEVRLMCHFQQMKLATFTQKIENQMLKLMLNRETGIRKGRK